MEADYIQALICLLVVNKKNQFIVSNKATPVACGWAGAIYEVARLFGQEQ